MGNISRRNVLKTGAFLAAGAAGVESIPSKASAADRAGSKYNWGHTMDFGEQYFTRMFAIVENIKNNEMNLIGDISSRMAEAIKKGGNGFMHAQAGHMGYVEFLEGHKGNPRILKSSTAWGGSDYEMMKPGDVLVTNYVNENVRKARDNGVYVAGVPVNYVDNEWAPRGFVSPNVNDWLLKDVSSVILQSYIPYHQGIVDCPEVPEMKICPSAANSLNTLFWMFQAEVANKANNRKAKHCEMAGRVMDTVLDRIKEAFRLQKDYIFDHAATVAKKICGGAHYHTTSDHRGVQDESNGVAMGPMMTNAYRRWEPGTPYQYVQAVEGQSDMKKGDVHLFATIEPDSPKIIEETKNAKDAGMFTVAIAPGNSHKLREFSDVFIDNLSPEGGGLLKIKGIDEKVATVGGVLNNWLAWIFTAQFIDEMVRRGSIPWFWLGWYQKGGREYDDAIRPFFLEQGF